MAPTRFIYLSEAGRSATVTNSELWKCSYVFFRMSSRSSLLIASSHTKRDRIASDRSKKLKRYCSFPLPIPTLHSSICASDMRGISFGQKRPPSSA